MVRQPHAVSVADHNPGEIDTRISPSLPLLLHLAHTRLLFYLQGAVIRNDRRPA